MALMRDKRRLSAVPIFLFLANSVYCLGTDTADIFDVAAVKLSTGCVKLIDVAKLACCLKHGDHYIMLRFFTSVWVYSVCSVVPPIQGLVVTSIILS